MIALRVWGGEWDDEDEDTKEIKIYRLTVWRNKLNGAVV
jgi:hypothetical protein